MRQSGAAIAEKHAKLDLSRSTSSREIYSDSYCLVAYMVRSQDQTIETRQQDTDSYGNVFEIELEGRLNQGGAASEFVDGTAYFS